MTSVQFTACQTTDAESFGGAPALLLHTRLGASFPATQNR